MAQNVTVQGASYTAVPAVHLPKTGGGTASFIDVTDTTATASDVASGKYFYTSAGVLTAGTSSGGGGSSSWTKVGETFYTTSTTSTTATTVATWSTGDRSIWDNRKIIYVRIRDTAGRRAGYFYGTDNFYQPYLASAGATSGQWNGAVRNIWRIESNNSIGWRYGYSTVSYGVYSDVIYSDGRIRIQQRYHSSYSRTIDGTFKVEAYILEYPDGVGPFD